LKQMNFLTIVLNLSIIHPLSLYQRNFQKNNLT
jgi:hypothetical protein